MAKTMLALASVLGFLISAVTGCFWVPLMRRLHCGQTIKTKDGPSWHAKKNGTPTMGGVCFIVGSLVSLGIVRDKEQRGDLYLILSVLVLFAAGSIILYYIGWNNV